MEAFILELQAAFRYLRKEPCFERRLWSVFVQTPTLRRLMPRTTHADPPPAMALCEVYQRAVRDGDDEAVAALVEAETGFVFRTSFKRLNNEADAEDVTQETFMTFLKNRASIREPDRLRSWLCSVARRLAEKKRKNRFGNWPSIRAQPPELQSAATFEDPAQLLIRTEERTWIARAIHRLRGRERQCLDLLAQGKDPAEAAKLLGMTSNAFHSAVSRGLSRLRQQLHSPP